MSLPEYEVRFTEDAKADLFGIMTHIARKSSFATAEQYVERLTDACLALRIAPHRGTLQPQLGKGVRTYGYRRSATIVTVVNDDLAEVSIVGVHYGGRNIEKTMKGRQT